MVFCAREIVRLFSSGNTIRFMEGQFLVFALVGLGWVGVLIASFGVRIPPSDVENTELDDEPLTQGSSRHSETTSVKTTPLHS